MSLDANKGGDIPKIAIILKTERGMHDATWPPAHALHLYENGCDKSGAPCNRKVHGAPENLGQNKRRTPDHDDMGEIGFKYLA